MSVYMKTSIKAFSNNIKEKLNANIDEFEKHILSTSKELKTHAEWLVEYKEWSKKKRLKRQTGEFLFKDLIKK